MFAETFPRAKSSLDVFSFLSLFLSLCPLSTKKHPRACVTLSRVEGCAVTVEQSNQDQICLVKMLEYTGCVYDGS